MQIRSTFVGLLRLRRTFSAAGQDVRYAARRLRRAPAFTLSAVTILVAGISLNLTFFQLLNAAVLRPLPVTDLDTLVRFDRLTPRFSSNGFPYPSTQFIREHNDVLTAVLTSSASDVVWGDDGNDRLSALYVSANWFRELGYGAASGRLFGAAVDDHAGADPVLVISHALWRTRFQGEAVVGRAVRVNGHPATIVGVAPEGFPSLELDDTQVWLPIAQMEYFNDGLAFATDWRSFNTQLYGRLKPGLSLAAARDGLGATVRALAAAQPDAFTADEVLQPYAGRDGFRGPRDRAELRTVTLLAGGLLAIVLVVTCANLGNLVVAQAMGRVRELGVRAALGASPWRLVRQQLIESALLTGIATAGGLLISQWGARLVAAQASLPSYVRFTVDWRIVAAAGVIAALATVAIGVFPGSLLTRWNLVTAMRDGGQQTTSGVSRARVRLLSITAQVAGCCVLLIVAGMTVRGLQRVLDTRFGFELTRITILDPSLSRYGISGAQAQAYWDEVKRGVAAIPDADQIALASHPPFAESASRSIYTDAPRISVTQTIVEPSFFALLRIPLLQGRPFAPGDSAGAVAIVSRRLALEMYGTLDVVGRGFPRSKPSRTIVGVAADAPLVNVTATNVAELYVPLGPADYGRVILLTSARADARRLLQPLREASRTADARVLPKIFLPLTQFEARVQQRQAASLATGLTGALTLVLACVGIFGVVACASSLRAKEIGIRRALGAQDRAVVWLLLRQLALPVTCGTAIGAIAGVAVSRVLEGDPFYLPAADVATPLVALGVFVLTAAVAALVPALRALRHDPLVSLRSE